MKGMKKKTNKERWDIEYLFFNRALLVEESLEAPYNTLNNFLKCRIPQDEVCIYGDGATAEFWKISLAPTM